MLRIGPAGNLIHRGRVELDGMLQDVTFHIVFTLVFDVGLGLGDVIKRVTLLFTFNYCCKSSSGCIRNVSFLA